MSLAVAGGRSSDAPHYGPFAGPQAARRWLEEAHCVFIQIVFPVGRRHYRLCLAGRPKRIHSLQILARTLPPEAGDWRTAPNPTPGRHVDPGH